MNRQSRRSYHPRVYEEACSWFVDFRTGQPDEPTRRAFFAWLQEAPAHMAAYLDVAEHWQQAGTLQLNARFTKERLIAEAIRDNDNLLTHPVAADHSLPPREPGSRSRRPIVFARATAVVTALLAAGVLAVWLRTGPTYATAIGEQRVVTLSDGTLVRLNAHSKVQVHFTPTEREIDLIEGEALFTDTRDARPFVVRSGGALAWAIGTEFDVNRQSTGTTVTVLQGKVLVSANPVRGPLGQGATGALPGDGSQPTAAPVSLSVGEQVTVAPSSPLKATFVNPRNVIGWTHGELVFVGTPLRDVVEEFNRYHKRQLVITSPSIGSLRIDGVFLSTEPTSLLHFLSQRPDVRVTESDGEIQISTR